MDPDVEAVELLFRRVVALLQVEDRHGGRTMQTFELTIRDQDRSQELASARN